MIIDNAAIKMQTGHHQQHRTEHSGALNFFNNRSENRLLRHHEHNQQDQLKLSDAAKLAGTQETNLDLQKKPDAEHSLNIQIIQSMFKSVTGQDLQLFDPRALQGQADQVTVQEPPQAPDQPANSDSGLVYQQSMSYFESQTITFNAQGSINTKDGQSVNFSVSLSMSHIFYAEASLNQQSSDAANTDPLSVDFEGFAAELTTTSFQFVLDSKGSQGQIATLKSNNSTQTPDVNQAVALNDKSEPASPAVGNSLDAPVDNGENKNQLIAVASSVYKQLRIWQKNTDGSQQLLALGEKNIGALYLGHMTKPLQAQAEDPNLSSAEVANNDINAKPTNQAGSLQQINFTA